MGNEPQAQILQDGTLMLAGVIGNELDGLTSARVISEIRALGKVAELRVLINSPGGLVAEGLAIYHELATHPARVVVEIAGVAASMASAIAMAGDVVRIAKNGMLMVHNPLMNAVGNADDLRRAAEMLDQFGTSLVNIYATKTGLPEDKIREMMAAETWLTAEEALALGFVDEIVEPVPAKAFADIDVSGLVSVPAALTRLIREGRMSATAQKDAEAKAVSTPATEPAATAGGTEQAKAVATQTVDVEATVEKILAAERERTKQIYAIASKSGLGDAWAREQIERGATVEQARAAALDALVERQKGEGPNPIPDGVTVSADERDKFIEGAVNWLVVKSGNAGIVAQHTKRQPDPGEFRGMTLLDLAKACLERSGVSVRGRDKMEIARLALASANAGLGTRSDFPILLENALHKMLMAAYSIQPDTWRRFCAVGSVSDFRPHKRLRLGSFSRLDPKLESGEFRQKHFPDAEKEEIAASVYGNIVGLSREAIVNDDLDGFSRMVTMLGRAAALSIEIDVYALLTENGGLGPIMSDGKTLFHADHYNIGTASALTVEGIDNDRVVMAQQKDPEGNEYLDLRPAVLVVPISLGGTARVINDAQYDPTSNALQTPNKVRGLFRDIVDTPRLTGTRRYLFADPAIAPVIEVVFLDGQQAPVIEVEEGFDYDGVRWRVRHDYGVGAIDWRGAVTNAGSSE